MNHIFVVHNVLHIKIAALRTLTLLTSSCVLAACSGGGAGSAEQQFVETNQPAIAVAVSASSIEDNAISIDTDGNQEVAITWPAIDDAQTYLIYKNGMQIGETSAKTFREKNTDVGEVDYSVIAVLDTNQTVVIAERMNVTVQNLTTGDYASYHQQAAPNTNEIGVAGHIETAELSPHNSIVAGRLPQAPTHSMLSAESESMAALETNLPPTESVGVQAENSSNLLAVETQEPKAAQNIAPDSEFIEPSIEAALPTTVEPQNTSSLATNLSPTDSEVVQQNPFTVETQQPTIAENSIPEPLPEALPEPLPEPLPEALPEALPVVETAAVNETSQQLGSSQATVELHWAMSTSQDFEYYLYFSDSSTGEFEFVKSVNASLMDDDNTIKTQFSAGTDLSLNLQDEACFKISAIGVFGESALSDLRCVTIDG